MKNERVMAVFQFFALVFCVFEHFPSIFRGFCFLLTLSNKDSLLNSGHFDLWMGKIGWKMSELWPFFSFLHFWALSVDFSGFLLSDYSFLKDSLLHSEHFGLLLGKIAWKLRELWPFLVLSTFEHFPPTNECKKHSDSNWWCLNRSSFWILFSFLRIRCFQAL